MLSRKRAPFAYELESMVQPFPDLTVSATAIYCKICKCRFYFSEQRQCEIHLKTRKHVDNKLRGIPRSEFLFDLCMWLCACNIPFKTLDRLAFHDFFYKYMPQCRLPSESYLRKRYIPRVYNDVVNNIKGQVHNRYVYVAVDETRDRGLNRVVHVVIRCLGVHGTSPPLLLGSKRITWTTAETMESVVRDALLKFDIRPEQVLVLVTDAVPYMLHVGKSLRKAHSDLVHFTCLAHALHRVAEEIRSQYQAVDLFMFYTKEIFANSPNHRRSFIMTMLHVPLPPAPVHTQWGSWIACVLYYAKYFEEVKAFILKLSSKESSAVWESQHYFRSSEVENDICTIAQNFECLVTAIQKLESESLSIHETFSIIDNVRTKLDELSEESAVTIRQKFYTLIEKNPGFTQLRKIHEASYSEYKTTSASLHEFYRYTPMTSVDVERSFSLYNKVYRPQRMGFTDVSLEQILCIVVYNLSLTKQNSTCL